MPAAAPEPPRRVIRISVKSAVLAIVAVVLTILAQRLFIAAHEPLSWAVAAVVVAVLIYPIVGILDRRLPHILSVIIALVVAAAATWGVIYVAFDDLSSGVNRLGESARDAAEELENRDDSIGRVAREVDASRRVDLVVDTVNERVTGPDDVLASTAGTAPTYFIAGILTLFIMSYGPRLAQAAVDQVPDPRVRRDVEAIVPRALRRSRRAILLTVAESVVIGLVVAGAALLLDVPAPAALGLAAGVMSILPHVGLVLGTLPLILLVLALKPAVVTVVTVVIVLACQIGDSIWLRRRIALHSVDVGLLVPWVVALVGYKVYGVGGVAYGLALAVFVLAVLDELGRRSGAVEAADAAGAVEAPDAAAATEAATGEAVAESEAERPTPVKAGVPGYVRAE